MASGARGLMMWTVKECGFCGWETTLGLAARGSSRICCECHVHLEHVLFLTVMSNTSRFYLRARRRPKSSTAPYAGKETYPLTVSEHAARLVPVRALLEEPARRSGTIVPIDSKSCHNILERPHTRWSALDRRTWLIYFRMDKRKHCLSASERRGCS